MSAISPPEKFDVETVQLQGSNLIEASAGTGKTYSIAILVLRLIIEKNVTINEILMVTFTKAAVAELEERIRLFVRTAYKASMGEVIKDETIYKLVQLAIKKETSAVIQQKLKTAILFLDETSVLTIHSFCQQTLTVFAFETNQLFGAETLQDTSGIILEVLNTFWRQNITTIPSALLGDLIDSGLTRSSISGIVKEHLNGKKYLNYVADKNYTFASREYDQLSEELKQLQEKEEQLRSSLYTYIEKNKQDIINQIKGNAYVTKNILPDIDSPETFINSIWNKKDKTNVLKVFETTLLPMIQACEDVVQEHSNRLRRVISDIYGLAINKIISGVNEYKQRNNLLSFDDMIVNLHKAFVNDNSGILANALQAKYKAVFIDEFQDTDRLQYEIFQKAFGQQTILFYIGDPKQSIYAWRKADIFTYFKAYQQVDKRYNMNQNFRSAASYIHAMNLFFLPQDPFDTFYFKDAPNAIRYIPVESPKNNKKGDLLYESLPVVPVSIVQLNNKDEIINAVAAQVADLLATDKYTITKDEMIRSVTPADIGILVRTNGEGQMIKNALTATGIPAVTINDARVLQSSEAVFFLYLLQAFHQLTSSGINKALLSPFTGFKIVDILQLDDEKTITLFRNYRTLWANDGIYAAMMQFVADYQVRSVLLAGYSESGERIITNLFQLTELVHKIQSDKNFSPAELIGWMQRCIEGMETEGDQYEQRIENDEEAVKIVTIHKSKGLEYEIVLAPFLDFTIERRNAVFCSFRHPDTGEYVTVEKDSMTPLHKQWMDEQTEQENRRLLYVAITRAVYKCFIFQNSYYKNSTLSHFVNAINPDIYKIINFTLPPSVATSFKEKQQWQPAPTVRFASFELQQKNWSRISYTMLAAKGETSSKPRSGNVIDRYDQFIFKQLTRGAKTGNLLHYVFENIDFASEQSWPYFITQAIKRFAPRHEKEYSEMLLQLLQHITRATIQTGQNTFMLSSVSKGKRLNELEFDFNVPLFSPPDLQAFHTADTSIGVKYFEQAEGIMNGKIDLFFEHNDRYYILDWKSNYLGDDVVYYEPSLLNAAMNESNYHLQYLIYTVAVKKYLQSRLTSFNYEKHFGGVIYMYVRGVRSGTTSGVFATRPSLHQIEMLEKMVSD